MNEFLSAGPGQHRCCRLHREHPRGGECDLYSPFWAGQIIGHRRARLHALEHRYAALHSSTDSILTQATDIPAGSGLGDLEAKARGRLVLARNKLYVLLAPDGKVLKSTLHGFQGSAETLLDLLRRDENAYRNLAHDSSP